MSHIAVMIFTKPRYAHFTFSDTISECDIPVPGILLLFGWYRYRKNLVPKKVLVSVQEKFGAGTGTFPGIFLFLGGKNLSRKKEPIPVTEKFGPVKKYRYGYQKNWSQKKVPVLEKFWVPSHSAPFDHFHFHPTS